MKILFIIYISFLTVYAGHPLKTEDTGLIGRFRLEFELPLEYSTSGENSMLVIPFKAGIGITDYLDLYAGLNHHTHVNASCIHGLGFGDLLFELKSLLYSGTKTSTAIKAAVTFPTGRRSSALSAGKCTYGVNFIISRRIGNIELNLDAGYMRNDNTSNLEEDLWNIYFSSIYQLCSNINVYAETGIYRCCESRCNPIFIAAGAAINIYENFYLDGLLSMPVNKLANAKTFTVAVTCTI